MNALRASTTRTSRILRVLTGSPLIFVFLGFAGCSDRDASPLAPANLSGATGEPGTNPLEFESLDAASEALLRKAGGGILMGRPISSEDSAQVTYNYEIVENEGRILAEGRVRVPNPAHGAETGDPPGFAQPSSRQTTPLNGCYCYYSPNYRGCELEVYTACEPTGHGQCEESWYPQNLKRLGKGADDCMHWNDKISSIRVVVGHYRFWENWDYRGHFFDLYDSGYPTAFPDLSVVFDPSDGFNWNNKISSIERRPW